MTYSGYIKHSLRWQIMFAVVIAFIAMAVFVFVTMSHSQAFLDRLGGSYETNAALTDFSTKLSETEKAMEDYMKYRTFESIDAYYHWESLSEDAASAFYIPPSTDSVRSKEHSTFEMAISFFSLSRDAVTAQRANNKEAAKTHYERSLQCYAMLQTEIEELNTLLLERNAAIYNENRKNFETLAHVSAIVLICFFLLVFMVIYLSITAITMPLSDISNVAMRIASMDFDVPLFNSQAQDEVGTICRAFDRMIVSIQSYIDKIWEKAAQENELKEKELEMRELYAGAQLRALQNQINPHFLFNTLNTGAQLAMMEGADKTCYFMEQVADFFRYNIQEKGQASTVREELSLVDNFVYIMKVRFGDRLTFIKDIPEGDFNAKLPRMTLQPLVENCIKHGLKGERGKVTLAIRGDVFSTTITISDNGTGFDEQMKQTILTLERPAENNDSTGTGTGLVNVISRLRLYFHRADVFDIQGNEDGGTTFLLRIPNV